MLALWTPSAWSDSPVQPGTHQLLDIGLWVAILYLVAFWHGIRRSREMARQRRYGRALCIAAALLAAPVAWAQAPAEDPCSEEKVQEWRRQAYVAAQEASRNTQRAIAEDPESPPERIRREIEAVEEELEACRVTAHEEILAAGKGVLEIIKGGAEGLGDLIENIGFPDLERIDLKRLACRVLVTADDLAVGGVELIAGLPRGIETDMRYAIWRNRRQAENRSAWVLRYARHAPRRWSTGQVRGFVYETRKELAGGYPDRPWPDDWY